jgi:hypothetical protein
MRYTTLLAATIAACLTASANAHFLLIQPAPMILQNKLGDPQKLAPCGGASANPAANTPANPGTATGAVTELKGGAAFHFLIQETVFHPGHYRVALARTAAQLPADPVAVTKMGDRGEQSVSAPIQDPAVAPVLADGLFAHTEKPTGLWEGDVQIPNIACRACMLQVVEFMAEHGRNRDGDFSYHHCAAVNITPDPAKPIDTRW